jgi:hypothetical protein
MFLSKDGIVGVDGDSLKNYKIFYCFYKIALTFLQLRAFHVFYYYFSNYSLLNVPEGMTTIKWLIAFLIGLSAQTSFVSAT